jgi:hypothetical protein
MTWHLPSVAEQLHLDEFAAEMSAAEDRSKQE